MNVTPRFAVCLILPLLLLLALPLPLHAEKPDQPQTIRALAKAGKAIYAAGDGGTVLRSSDGGASWTALSGGRGANFQAVVAEGDQAWLLGGRGIEGHPTRWGQGMLLVATAGADSVSRRKLDQAGWLYGGTLVGPLGVLLGQANPLFPGGAIRLTQHDHLAKIDTPQQGPFLGGVFATPQTGYAVGPDLRVLDIRQLGFLLVQPERLASSSSLRTAAIGQDGRVWAAGDNGAVLHSQATGQNWTQPNLSLPMGTTRLADFSALTVDGQRIWIGGGFLGSILYSDTNGARFELRKAPGPVTALLHVEDDILIAAGPAGRIWRSDDAGRSWKQTYGPERLDVLIIATPWQRSALTAVAATHISGARAGILWTALQPDDPYVPGDQALRAAAIAAGACQVQAISEFTSPTLQGEGDRLEQADILQLWRRRIDADPTEELALQLAAAIRLYRPRVLVLPPQKGPKTGTGAEAALLGQIAIAAAELASRTTGDRNLSAIGLDPFTPDRIFWALPDNEQSARPWALPARDSRADLVIDSTKYPAELGTNLEMLALRAVSLLGDAGPVRRPSLKPAWKRLGPGGQVDLFTTGLLPALLDEKVNPPDGQANGEVADAVAVRRALLRNNLAGALGEVTRQARTGGRDDPLPADRALLLWEALQQEGQLEAARQALDAYLQTGKSHPLYQRMNMLVLLRWYSAEFRAQLRPGMGLSLRPPGDMEKALDALGEMSDWVNLPAVRIARARALMQLGKGIEANKQLQEMLDGPLPDAWKRMASYSIAGQAPVDPSIPPLTLIQPDPAGAEGKLDGKLDEKPWTRTMAYRLREADGSAGAGGYEVSARFLRSVSALLIGLELEQSIAGNWQVQIAIDADGDAVSQLILTLSSRGELSARITQPFGPDLPISDEAFSVRGNRGADNLSIEMAIPLASLGKAPRTESSCFIQIVAEADVEPAVIRQLNPGPRGDLAAQHAAWMRIPAFAPPAGQDRP